MRGALRAKLSSTPLTPLPPAGATPSKDISNADPPAKPGPVDEAEDRVAEPKAQAAEDPGPAEAEEAEPAEIRRNRIGRRLAV